MRKVILLPLLLPIMAEGLLMNATGRAIPSIQKWDEQAKAEWDKYRVFRDEYLAFRRDHPEAFKTMRPGDFKSPPAPPAPLAPLENEAKLSTSFAEYRASRELSASEDGMFVVSDTNAKEWFPDLEIDEELNDLALKPLDHPYVLVEGIHKNLDGSATIEYSVTVGTKKITSGTSISQHAILKLQGKARQNNLFNIGELGDFLVTGRMEFGAKGDAFLKANNAMAAVSVLIVADIEAKFPNIDGLGADVKLKAGIKAEMSATVDFAKGAVGFEFETFAGAAAAGKLKLRWLNLKAKAQAGVGAECRIGMKDGTAEFEFGGALGVGGTVGVDICFGQIAADVGKGFSLASLKARDAALFIATYGCKLRPRDVITNLRQLGKKMRELGGRVANWWR